MSKFDSCIFAEYFGEYGMRLCNHPSKANNHTIYENSCRRCKLHTTEKNVVSKCPFCGHNASLSQYRGYWHIKCCHCGAKISDKNIETTLSKWNKRIGVD